MAKTMGVLFLLAAGTCLLAEDFWVRKKFPEWTEKEVRQMMSNSPWAQKVEVPLGSMAAGGGGRGSRGAGGRSRGGGGIEDGGFGGPVTGAGAPGGPGGPGGGFPGAGGRGAEPEAQSVPTLPLVIRWQSALPVRQAIARNRFGAEAGTSQEAAKFLAPQEEYYVVAIAGLPGRMIETANPESLKSASGLKIGKSAPLAPADIRVNRGQPMSELLLIFPRSGHPVTLEDKEVEVVTSLGPLQVRKKFRLKEMVFESKLEL